MLEHLTTIEWIILIVGIAIVILQLINLLRKRTWFNKFITWIRPSAEGENKTASGRRLTAFVVTAISYNGGTIAFFSYAFTRHDGHLIDPWVFIAKFFVDILFIGLLWGFINQQTLVALRTGGGLSDFSSKTSSVSTTQKIVEKTTEKINDETINE